MGFAVNAGTGQARAGSRGARPWHGTRRFALSAAAPIQQDVKLTGDALGKIDAQGGDAAGKRSLPGPESVEDGGEAGCGQEPGGAGLGDPFGEAVDGGDGAAGILDDSGSGRSHPAGNCGFPFCGLSNALEPRHRHALLQ